MSSNTTARVIAGLVYVSVVVGSEIYNAYQRGNARSSRPAVTNQAATEERNNRVEEQKGAAQDAHR